MRPPRIAAEYRGAERGLHRRFRASMRPPRIAAEYHNEWLENPQTRQRFNEAAANRGGIRTFGSLLTVYGGSFNEAAANRGGIPSPSGTPFRCLIRLQ